MIQFQRQHVETVLRLLRLEKPLIVAVIGPRRTGKTTIVRDVLRQNGVRACTWPPTNLRPNRRKRRARAVGPPASRRGGKVAGLT